MSASVGEQKRTIGRTMRDAGYQLWPDASRRVPRPWPDPSVRRVVDVSFPVGLAAVIERLGQLLDAPSGHRGPAVLMRGDSGWLACEPTNAVMSNGEWRLPGAVHVHRLARSAPVELVLAPWSARRSELRLEPRPRRGLAMSARYFIVAHAVMDDLRDAVEAGAE